MKKVSNDSWINMIYNCYVFSNLFLPYPVFSVLPCSFNKIGKQERKQERKSCPSAELTFRANCIYDVTSSLSLYCDVKCGGHGVNLQVFSLTLSCFSQLYVLQDTHSVVHQNLYNVYVLMLSFVSEC